MDFKFSIIMATYNASKWIEEAINSVINQTLDFKTNVQLIIVDDGSSDNTKEICNVYTSKYSDNIVYLEKENGGQASARNMGLKHAKGEYINFLDSDDKLEVDVLEKVLMFFERKHSEIDVVSIPLIFFDGKEEEHILNYKYSSTRVIDLLNEYDCIQLSASSSFIRKNSIKDFNFDNRLITSEDALFINQILLNTCKMGVIHDTCYYYRQREDVSSTTDNFKTRREYYIEQAHYFMKKILKFSKEELGFIPKFIQYLVAYTLQWMFEIPQINNILNSGEIEELYTLLKEVLSDIEDNIILEQKFISETLKYHILHEKYGKFEKEIQFNTEHLKIGNTVVDTLGVKSFWIDIIEVRDNELYISGYLPSFFSNKKTQIKAIVNNIEYSGEEVFYPKRNMFSLGKTVEERLHVDLHIPLEASKVNIVNFRVRYDIEVDLPIQFSMNARLSRISHYSRVSQMNTKIQYNQFLLKNIDNAIIVEPFTKKKYLKLELSTLRNIYRKKPNFYKEVLFLRIVYFILFNTVFNNKKIWLFMDRQDTAKDNGEHLFKYARQQNDNIKKYFIIKNETSDYKRLKTYGQVVDFGSLKHKILFLFADKIVSSHPDDEILNPFWGEEIYSINGLLSSQYIFLQHGIINEDLSSWLKKADMNLTIFTCSAEKEYDSIFEYDYNYSKDVVKILGLPRFDLLENNNLKNQILLMPSWRHQFNNLSYDEFKQTAYFKCFNTLLNDEEFLNYLKNKNYKILFKPHYNMVKYLHLFLRNDSVVFDEDLEIDYTSAFNESKLLITDHSSVFYDFSYLKKPIIYYHFKDDVPKFEGKPSEFNFEEDGFGKVIENHDKLIEAIKYYIENDFKLEEKYEKRIDNFYMFHDRNNRKRNYDAIMKLYE